MKNKIISLTKVFLKSAGKNIKILNNKEEGKNSNFLWMLIIIAAAIALISYKGIEFFISIGAPQIFLTIYLIILSIILMFGIILVTTNILFFSKDLEYILPMPIKPIEILLSKYVVLLVTTYITEAVFAAIPLTIYGLLAAKTLLYFIEMVIILLIFPALFVTIIAILAIILMRILRVIKNKNINQTIVTTILLIMVLAFETITMNVLYESQISETDNQEYIKQATMEMYTTMGSGYLIVNPTREILTAPNEIQTVATNFGKIIAYNIAALAIFLVIGKTVYLKNILLATSNISPKSKKHKEIKYEKKSNTIAKAYIKKDFKQLIRNPIFFMQLVFPVILILISMVIIGSFVIPTVDGFIKNNDTISNALKSLEFNSTAICIILCALQVLFSMSSISLTAVSRERENAIYLKNLPISLYKQFLYKNALQIMLNLIVSIVTLTTIYVLIEKISIIQILLIFIISILINLINSFVNLIVDFKRPILNWDSEYEITKNNPNKIFQYMSMLSMILILLYILKVAESLSTNIYMLLHIAIFLIAFILINLYVKKNIRKIFRKIS